MPPLRRRKVSSQVNISIGSLLADSEKQRLTAIREQETTEQAVERVQKQEEHKVDRAYVEAERSRVENERAKREAAELVQKAETEKREKESARMKRYQQIFNDYKDGTASYTTTIEALQNAVSGGEPNKDIVDQLKGAVSSVKLLKINRDIDKDIADFNSGAISYSELRNRLDGTKSDNETVKARISTTISSARSTENSRQIQKGLADYQSGKKSIDQMLTDFAVLRADPTQKNPADLDKIEQAIQSGMQIKSQLADQSTYSNWQSGAISDGEAQAYFRARVATARDPKDAQAAAQALANVTQTIQKKGSSQADAFDKAINSRTKENHDAFKKDLDKAVKLCDGDPYCVKSQYDAYGEFLKNQAALGGSAGPQYLDAAAQAGVTGDLEASFQQREKLNREIAALRKELDDPKLSIDLYALKQGQIAALAQTGVNSQYQTPQARKDFLDERKRAADELLNKELQLQKEAEKLGGVSKQEILGAYSALSSSKNLYGEGGKSLIETFKDAGLAFDGTAADKAKFYEWMAQAPEDRANQVFDILNPTTPTSEGGLKRPADETRDKFVSDITNAVKGEIVTIKDRSKTLDTFLTVANPGITNEEKKIIIKVITTTEKYSTDDALNTTKNSSDLLTQLRTVDQIAVEDANFAKDLSIQKETQRAITTIPDPVNEMLRIDTETSVQPAQAIPEQQMRVQEQKQAAEEAKSQVPPLELGKFGKDQVTRNEPLYKEGDVPEDVQRQRDIESAGANPPDSTYVAPAQPQMEIPQFDFGYLDQSEPAQIDQADTPSFGQWEPQTFEPQIQEFEYPTFDWNPPEENTGGGGSEEFSA